MRGRMELREIVSVFRPLILYMIMLWAVSAVMEAAGGVLAESLLRDGGSPAGTYTLKALWICLSQLLPPAAGFLFVRGTLAAEICAFAARYPLSGRLKDRMIPVLMVGTMALAAAVNIILALAGAGAGSAGPATGLLPGFSGFAAEAVVFGVCIPLIEEGIFRGILLSRLERTLGLWPAVFFSSALFGAYHGSPVQAVYAMIMGMVFALSYTWTGRPAVPAGLHGACNLLILLLNRTGAWRTICTPAWAAALTAIAAAAFYTVLRGRDEGRMDR